MLAASDKSYGSYKNKKKAVRCVNELLVLLICVCLLFLALTTVDVYEPYDPTAVSVKDNGFIALSYFGVDLSSSETLMNSERLEAHLKALRDSGYVTVTQQDILDYYQTGKKLPERALFLMFEDGRRDTAIFAEKILEKLNQKATILTYADRFEKNDNMFLSPKELQTLEESTFWELGTNGYRLAYINVFNRHGTYFGQVSATEFNHISPYVDRNYNHFLMDYIRDAYEIPMESHAQMRERIQGDYALMRRIYSKELGTIPSLYVLMHSNTGMFGTNKKASAVNEAEIYKTFPMNFNREGYSLNTAEVSLYDLTRMQPQANWSVNHLLMRIWDDTGLPQAFLKGDPEIASRWEVLEGAAECTDQRLALTTLPAGRGLMRLRGSEDWKDFSLSVRLTGNKLGGQSIYLWADEGMQSYAVVRVEDNVLTVAESAGGGETALFAINLDAFDGTVFQTKEQDRQASEQAAIYAKRTYGDKTGENRRIISDLTTSRSSQNGNDGDYVPPLGLKTAGNRLVSLTLQGGRLSVFIDKKLAAEAVLSGNQGRGIYLESRSGQSAYSQRNLADDVYDGVFESLVISGPSAQDAAPLYNTLPKGWDAFSLEAKEAWKALTNWFIKTL